MTLRQNRVIFNMMNINEFERKKPKKTYNSIIEFEKYIQDCEKHGLNFVPMKWAKDHLEKIKENFLSGE